MAHLTPVTWMPKQKPKTWHCIFHQIEIEIIYSKCSFFQELMGRDLYVSDRDLSILHCVCLCMCVFVCMLEHILNKDVILLSMFWASRQTDQRHYSAGHVRPWKAQWIVRRRADIHDHNLLFPPPLLSLVFFYAIHVEILILFFRNSSGFKCLSNSAYLPTCFLSTKGLPPSLLMNLWPLQPSVLPLCPLLCIHSQLLNIVRDMTVLDVLWISVYS